MALQELSEKKQLLLGKLETTLRELQQAQSLASTEGGSISGMYAILFNYHFKYLEWMKIPYFNGDES